MRAYKLLICLFILHVCNTIGFCQSEDYRFWITRRMGGNGYGKISSVNMDGSGYDNGVVFESALDGIFPVGKLLQGSDGYLYGATRDGGLYNRGVIFKMSQDGSSYLVLHHFTKLAGARPVGSLVESPAGKLYGVSRGAEGYPGVVFSFEISTNEFEIIHEFIDESEGTAPTSLMLASNGNLYGACERQGSAGSGTIFTIDLTNNTFKKLMDADGLYPGALMEGSDGRLYGTFTNGYYDLGQVYTINLDGSGYASVIDFYTDSSPSKELVEGSDGYLYGTCYTQLGRSIFKIQKNGYDFSVIHTLPGVGLNSHGLTLASDGLLYGIAYKSSGPGGLFYRMATDGSGFEKLTDLTDDFTFEVSSPIQVDDGSFYVTSTFRGRLQKGFLSKFLPDGTYSVVKQYASPFNNPFDVIHTKSGVYGFYLGGGIDGLGGVFKLSTNGSNEVTKLHENTIANQSHIQMPFVEDSYGNLYTYLGNASIGKFSTAGAVSKFFELPENTYDWLPVGPLFLAENGFLYGISAGAGIHGKGTLYSLKTDGTAFSITHDFTELTLYRQSIAFESNGILFGVCTGGDNGRGLIYNFDLATNTFKKIFDFTNYFGSITNRSLQLIKGTDNVIYGIALEGGVSKKGMIFKISMDGSGFQELRSFSPDDAKGYLPTGLLEGPDGKLYGITGLGGAHNTGVIFSINKDGSDYRIVFQLPEETELQIPALTELLLAPKVMHEVSLDLPPEIEFNEMPIELPALSAVGLLLTYISSNSDVAQIQGTSLTITGVGQVTITAEQVGNNFYTRTAGIKTLTVVPANQSITFDPIQTKSMADKNFELYATSSAGLPIKYSTLSDKITISGNKVTFLSPGSVAIVAHQEGNDHYNAASPTEQTFCINPLKPTIDEERNSSSILLTSSNDTGNQWYFNDAQITGATSKTLTVTENGNYAVRSTIDNCASEISDQYFSIITALESSTEQIVSIYPNPTQEKLIVEIPDTFPGEISIDILDALGNTVIGRKSTNRIEVIELKSLRPGLYFVQLRTGKEFHVIHILKI